MHNVAYCVYSHVNILSGQNLKRKCTRNESIMSGVEYFQRIETDIEECIMLRRYQHKMQLIIWEISCKYKKLH